MNLCNSGVMLFGLIFADDCIIYRPFVNPDHEVSFQTDLHNLLELSSKWGMKFNSSKCKVMIEGLRKRNPGKTDYHVIGSPLKRLRRTITWELSSKTF